MKKLLLVLVMLPLFTMAQFISVDGIKYRTLTEFKSIKAYGSDTIVGISVQDTTSPIGAAGYAIITNEDTTLMYLNDDTMNMFTTADTWKFTPKVTFKGNPNQILYYGTDSFLTTDNGFIFADTSFLLTVQNNTLSTNTNIIRSQNDVLILGTPLGGFIPHNTINIDTNGISFNYRANNVSYRFPTDTGQVGQQLFIQSIDTTGNNILAWGNKTLSNSATLDFGSIGAHAYEDLTITVNGAVDGDVVSLGAPNGSVPADASFFAWVSATDTVTVRCFNIDGGSIDPASGLFKVKVFK